MTPSVSAEDELIVHIADLLAEASSILFITGAGLSADSGLPTYRGVGGLYNHDETEDGVPIEVALSGPTFRARPELTWKYILQIESACRGARPNRAHDIIAALEKRLSRVWVLTQNVDGFHRAAGSDKVIDIHGDIHDLMCTSCGWRETVDSYDGFDSPPRCPLCNSVIRPDVVLFGEMLPVTKLNLLGEELGQGFDLVFSVGTTSVFPYIAQPVWAARTAGRPAIEINPGDSEVSAVATHRVRAGAQDAFEAIWTAYLQRTTS
ncbi:MAG: NAD-dependent protein deacylase [Myxococcota bacterium]